MKGTGHLKEIEMIVKGKNIIENETTITVQRGHYHRFGRRVSKVY
jgi:hypothetical protein